MDGNSAPVAEPVGEDQPVEEQPVGEDQPVEEQPVGEDQPVEEQPVGEDQPVGEQPVVNDIQALFNEQTTVTIVDIESTPLDETILDYVVTFDVAVGVARSQTFTTSMVAVRSDQMTEEDARNLSRASWERVKAEALAWFEGEDGVPVDLDEPKPCCVRQMIGTVFPTE